jgi:hypothetical protein
MPRRAGWLCFGRRPVASLRLSLAPQNEAQGMGVSPHIGATPAYREQVLIVYDSLIGVSAYVSRACTFKDKEKQWRTSLVGR